MSTITKEHVRERLTYLEGLNARGVGTKVSSQQFEIACLRKLLASLEAEAVITVGDDGGDALAYRRLIQTFAPGTKLYTAPPAPVSVLLAIHDKDFEKALSVLNDTLDDCGDSERGLLLALDKAGIEVRSNSCRAAMLQGAEPVTTDCKLRDAVDIIRNSGIAIDAEKILAERDALNAPDCWCRTCRPITLTDMRFVVCPECGNKRCPHANDHRNACTGSNEPGQEGSAYSAAPQQEVK